MALVFFRFYAELNDFLTPEHRGRRFFHALREAAAVKDTIEALGVPHPEVELILVNGTPVPLSHLLRDGDDVAVYPAFAMLELEGLTRAAPPLPQPARFAIDAHLSKLAAWLRLAGFDATVDDDDAELAAMSARDERIVLTRDVALLKRGVVRHGYWVRSTDPAEQLAEVVQRFHLADRLQPFTRCTRCNTPLRAVDAESVADRLLPCTRAAFSDFRECPGCGRVYWRGSHYER